MNTPHIRPLVSLLIPISAITLGSTLTVGCRPPQESGPESIAIEASLLHASGVCLARVTQIEEFNEIPSDGDHWFKVSLQPIQSSGITLPYLYVVKEQGGNFPPELMNASRDGPSVLKYDSLRVGEKHWFIFSNDVDLWQYPPQVAGWWPHRDRDVPQAVKRAVAEDRFRNSPQWDPTLNVVYEPQKDTKQDNFTVKVRDADSLASDAIYMQATFRGQITELKLAHWNNWPEFEPPTDQEFGFLVLDFVGELPDGNSFQLKPGIYPQRILWNPLTGDPLGHWIYSPQKPSLLMAYQQYRSSGQKVIESRFELLTVGGKMVGSDSDAWYRKTTTRYEDNKPVAESTFRHQYIHTGEENADSSYYWEPIVAQDDKRSTQ
jgi:hypothetical protein